MCMGGGERWPLGKTKSLTGSKLISNGNQIQNAELMLSTFYTFCLLDHWGLNLGGKNPLFVGDRRGC